MAERTRALLAAYVSIREPLSPRRRSTRPLILCGDGVSLNIEKGSLLIRDGFTHYPQERTEHRIFKGDPTRPTRILVVDGSGSVTFDVIDWLREQNIALVRVTWDGVSTLIGAPSAYATDADAIRRQDTIRSDRTRRLAFARRLIRAKLEASLSTLRTCLEPRLGRGAALAIIREKLAVLKSRQPLTVAELHGVEGRAAKAYFDAWTGTPLKWKASRLFPVPPSWKAIGHRQSQATGVRGKNRFASHPVNAMLNYAYAVLESQVRLDVFSKGLDPRLGFLHSGYRGSHALVLDLMEPLRPVVDASVLRLVSEVTFSGADFVLRPDGVVRLNPELARRVAQLAAAAARSGLGHLPVSGSRV